MIMPHHWKEKLAMKSFYFLGLLVVAYVLLALGVLVGTRPISAAGALPPLVAGLPAEQPGVPNVTATPTCDPAVPCDTPSATPTCRPGQVCSTATATPTCHPGQLCDTPTATPCDPAQGCSTPTVTAT